MMGVAFVGMVESPYVAIALLSLGGFAHQTLSVTVITMSSDLFKRSEVATVAGMAGTCGNAGVLIFSLLIGGLVTTHRLHAVLRRPRRARSPRRCAGWTLVDRTRVRETAMRNNSSRPAACAMTIANPILRGFNPDPSIVRVGDDYYIATSTFEWFPRRPDPPFARPRELAAADAPAQRAPASSTCSAIRTRAASGRRASRTPTGCSYLVYTDVKRYGRTTVAGASGASLRDFHNYLVTSPRIDGEWSDPVYLNSSGFDPSLFHDDDGRKYLVNMLWDHRPGPQPLRRHRAAGILAGGAQAGRRAAEHLQGTPLGFTEAPHLYKRDGWYYLITAEGRHRVGSCRDDGAIAVACRAVRAASRRAHPDRARIARTRRCNGRVMPTWSRRQSARPIWSICAAGRSATAAGARSAARRRFSR